MKLLEKVDGLKYQNGNIKEVKEEVVVDNSINLIINNENYFKFSAINDSLKEFAIGYLLGEGLIKSLNDIININIKDNNIDVKIKNNINKNEKILCSDAAGGLREKIKSSNFIDSIFDVAATDLIKNMEKLTDNAKIWKKTGGTHVAALVFEDKFILKEDVSRHVAVDKVIGSGALENVDFSRSYIIYSGRMPADMVIKLNRVKIPIIASNAAPAYSGYLIAKNSNMTMIGFLRGKNFNIYGNYKRIK